MGKGKGKGTEALQHTCICTHVLNPLATPTITNYPMTGRSSARETIGRVAAAAIAKKVLSLYSGVEIIGYVKKVQEIEATVDTEVVTIDQVNSRLVG